MDIAQQKPIAFMDIESTGVNKDTDRIIDIAFVTPEFEKVYRFNPGIPIPESATAIHGISNEDVKDWPLFKEFAIEILDIINAHDIAGFNSNAFDVPLLVNELNRCNLDFDHHLCNLIDIGNIYKILNPRTLGAAYKQYTGKELEGAHGALPDTIGTRAIFVKMMATHLDLPKTNEELALFSNYGKKRLDLAGKFTYNEKGEIILNFGQSKGQKASDNPGFLQWMIARDFPKDTLQIASDILYNTD